MAKRLKIAVIGTGFMGRVHLEQLQRVEGVDVVAVAGRELASAQKIAAGYGVQVFRTMYPRGGGGAPNEVSALRSAK